MNCKYINRKDFPPKDYTISEISQEKQKEDTKVHCFNANRTHISHPHLHFPKENGPPFFSVKTHNCTLANQRLRNWFLQKECF